MSYTFTTTQLSKINSLFTEAKDKGADAKGAYAQAYQYVADVLAGKVDKHRVSLRLGRKAKTCSRCSCGFLAQCVPTPVKALLQP